MTDRGETFKLQRALEAMPSAEREILTRMVFDMRRHALEAQIAADELLSLLDVIGEVV